MNSPPCPPLLTERGDEEIGNQNIGREYPMEMPPIWNFGTMG
jgi:hypothetical protein